MKKVSAFLLAVLLVVMLTVPAFASAYKSGLSTAVSNGVNAIVSATSASIKNARPYRIVLYQEQYGTVVVVYCSSSALEVGASVVVGTCNSSGNVYVATTPVTVNKVSIGSLGLAISIGSGSYVVDFSTAFLGETLLATVNPRLDYMIQVKNGTGIVSKTALLTQLQRADALDRSDDSGASWTALETAFAAAEYAYKTMSTADQVSTAAMNLSNAMDRLTQAPDCGVLSNLITQAEAKTESTYTAASWPALQAALSAARTLLQGESTQAQVDEAAAALQSAMDGLIPYDGPPLDLYDPILDGVTKNIAAIIPGCIIIFGLLLGLSLIPRVIRYFTHA